MIPYKVYGNILTNITTFIFEMHVSVQIYSETQTNAYTEEEQKKSLLV